MVVVITQRHKLLLLLLLNYHGEAVVSPSYFQSVCQSLVHEMSTVIINKITIIKHEFLLIK